MRRPKVLLVQLSSNRDGSAFSGLILADGFKKLGWETMVGFGKAGPMVDEYRHRGHQVDLLPHENWLRTVSWLRTVRNVWAEWRASRRIVDLIADTSPQVVYVNTGASLAGALAAWRSGVPAVWHLRELFSSSGGELKIPRGSEWLFRKTFRLLADLLVAPSKAVAKDLLGSGWKKVRIIPNAVDQSFLSTPVSRVEARRIFELPDARIVIGVPGTLRPMKGHDFLINALPELIRRYPDLLVVVTGSGQEGYLSSLRSLVDELEVGRYVRFIGSVESMPAFLAACDLACIPSRSEPFGRTVIEAFAARIPVVASAVDGILETVDHGENGLLVPFGDEAALVEAISRVIEDRALADRFTDAAAAKAATVYAPTPHQKSVVALVESYLSGQYRGIRQSRESAVLSSHRS